VASVRGNLKTGEFERSIGSLLTDGGVWTLLEGSFEHTVAEGHFGGVRGYLNVD